MAEAGAPTESEVKPVVVAEPVVETPPAEIHDDPDREPGGDTPQEIRARKEYRLRKRLEGELFELQQERAATNARLKTLEEVTKPQPPKQRVYTTHELQAAVDAGTISVVEAADYLAEQRAKQTADRVLKQEYTRNDETMRQGKAQEQIDKYVEVAPWLKDQFDGRRKPLEVEYQRLIDPNGIYRYPDSLVTEVLLLEKTLGSIETFKAKARLDKSAGSHADFHTESGAGGPAPTPRPVDGKPDMNKMPKHFVEYWEKSGTPQKEREKEAKLYFEKRGQPK
jgi:alkylated DNA repair dioxygenase AlkB